MAELFLAKQTGLSGFEKVVAIKRILPHLTQGAEFVDMFINEAKLAALLSHQNIVQIYDLGSIDQAYYIAMEYIMGKDLRTVLTDGKSKKRFASIGDVLLIISKICSALDYAHRKKDLHGNDLHLVHRDISPQNILISYEGEVKLVDFGIAKAAMGGQETKTGVLKGKLAYMSPEQAWGKQVDGRTDIFALGIVLYESLTGERLFSGNNEISILERVRKAEIAPPTQFNPAIIPELESILYKALAKEPENRYQSASEMQIALETIITQKGYAFSSLSLSHYMQTLYQELIAQDTHRFRLVTAGETPPPSVEDRSTVVRGAPRVEAPTPAQRSISQSKVVLPLPKGGGLSRWIAGLFFLIPSTLLSLLLIVSNVSFVVQARERFPFLEKTRSFVAHYFTETGISPYLEGFKSRLFSAMEKEPGASVASTFQEKLPPIRPASNVTLQEPVLTSEPGPSPQESAVSDATEKAPSPGPKHDIPALYLEAKNSYNAGDLESVEKTLRQIIEINPTAVLAYHLLGTVYQEKKELDAALRIFSEASALFPNDATLHYDVGFLYAQKGVDSLAVQELKMALKLDPTASGNVRAVEIVQKHDPSYRPLKQIVQQKNEIRTVQPKRMEPPSAQVRPALPPQESVSPAATRLPVEAALPSSNQPKVSVENEIRQLVSKQKRAFQSKNLDLVLEDHLDPSPALQKRLENWFQHYDAISVNYEIFEVKIDGNEASVSILQNIALHQKQEDPPQEVEKALVYWNMVKVADLWKITKINVVERY